MANPRPAPLETSYGERLAAPQGVAGSAMLGTDGHGRDVLSRMIAGGRFILLRAVVIGLLVGGRHLLALFLSIHVGVLMDRFGTRRVSLFFVWTAIALAPVFPLLTSFWPLMLLQIVNGGALSFGWSGSQTLIAQLAEGEAEYIGRFNFFARTTEVAAEMHKGGA